MPPFIGAVYRSPISAEEGSHSVRDYVQNNMKESIKIVLAGDLNLRAINWVTLRPMARARALLNLTFNFNLVESVTAPTRARVMQQHSRRLLAIAFLMANKILRW